MTSLQNYIQNNPLPTTANNVPPTATQKVGGFVNNNVTNPIKTAFKGGLNEVGEGYKQATSSFKPTDLIGGGLKMVEGVFGAAASPFAPITQPTIGAGVNALSNIGTDNSAYQKFAMSPAGQATSEFAGGVNQASNILGGTLGLQGAGEAVNNVWNKAYGKVATPTNPASNPQSEFNSASTVLDTTANTAVSKLKNATESVGDYKTDLGNTFRQGAIEQDIADPATKFRLTHDKIDALNMYKNNKTFSLPDFLKSEKVIPVNASDIESGGIDLTRAQTQDLIHQLNNSTFTEKASGLGVDQSKIGLTNEIKDAASKAFGNEWKQIYSDYSKGRLAIEKINDIINLDKDATASDVNKSLNSILKLGETPQGKVILQNSVEEFKQVSGIDLTDPVKAVHQIIDKQLEMVEKQTALKKAQTEAAKGSFTKRFIKAGEDPALLARRIVGGAISVGVLYPALRALQKAIFGQ